MIIGSKLFFFKELTSTNSHASLVLKKGGVSEGSVFHTDFQTSGKGRSGNRWESERGKNLLISIILYPFSLHPEKQFLLSITVSLGICDFIDDYFTGSKIKWPNDIYINDDKIAGILIENSVLDGSLENTIAGIGLNINQVEFPLTVPNPISLRKLTGQEYDTGTCLKRLLACIDNRYSQLLYGSHEQLEKDYLSRLYRLNEWHNFMSSGRVFKGMVTGISESGRLKIKEANGCTSEYDFKEAEYIR